MNDVIDNTEAEFDGGEFDLAGKREIYTRISDPEVRGMHEKCKKRKLNIQPDFQRQFVWDPAKCSHLIESAVYLSEEADGTQSVIDGQQRLTAFFAFIDGQFPGENGGEFKLSKLKVFDELNGKAYSDLPEEYQDRILNCAMRTIVFTSESHPDLKFEIFERLNSGSVKLNDQELRNCIYRGSYNKLLRELSANEKYMKLMHYTEPHKRMIDVQYVLRFVAFQHKNHLAYNPPIKKFLNEDMEHWRNISDEDAKSLRAKFKKAVDLVYSVFGANAFRKFSVGRNGAEGGDWESKAFNASLYDILMWSFAQADKNLVMHNADVIRHALADLITSDAEFIDAIGRSTSNKKMVERRFNMWRETFNSILDGQDTQARCFSYELKNKLYDKNPKCEICKNQITTIDDAALDHIEQYAHGGKTVPDNARLTHRYCNNARSRNNDENQ